MTRLIHSRDPFYAFAQNLKGVFGLLLCTFLSCTLACNRDIAGSRPRLDVIADTSLLTPEVARALGAGGLFSLATPPADSRDELQETEVRAIARAWIRQGFPGVRARLETQHGASIDASKLRECARMYYGESPYEELQDNSDGGIARRVYGPWWLVPLCVGNEPQVVLGISAYAGIHLENGQIRLSSHPGAEFVWRGVPAGAVIPVTPEAAANEVARRTAGQIASVPRLILPDFRQGSPAAARWEMAITPPPLVSSRGERPSRAASLFMGPPGPGPLNLTALQRPTADQPNEIQLPMWNVSPHTINHFAPLRRKPGLPVRFEPVEVATND
jgi:hypothetical protein